jgi:uncharacterized protein (DUF362 family)/ferredoxin
VTSQVAVVRCESYEEAQVAAALDKVFENIDLAGIVKPGNLVLLKPNLLAPRKPEAAVTTHPALVREVARRVLALGARVMVGDSSGGLVGGHYPTERSLRVSGMTKVCEELGITAVNFDTAGSKRVPVTGRFLTELEVARPVVEADVIINLPKLKTHSATLYTGAVKNMYGSVPGSRKADYHSQAPSARDFSRLLVDIIQNFTPQLNIVDGVVGMEGNGPGVGSPVNIGLIVAGVNPVLVDAVCCRAIGLDPSRVRYLEEAENRGLCSSLSGYSLVGDRLNLPVTKKFKFPTNLWFELNPPGITRFVMQRLKHLPYCDARKCTGCNICRDSCPVQAITPEAGGKGVVVDGNKCIQCLCCQELCPQGAFEIKASSWLGTLAMKIMEGLNANRPLD